MEDLFAFDFDYLDSETEDTGIPVICDEEFNVSGHKTISVKFIQCFEKIGGFNLR